MPSEIIDAVWQPDPLPDDDKPRMYRVYGYEFTGDPRAPLGDSLGQYGVGTVDQAEAVELRDRMAAEKPQHRWAVEWSAL